MYICVFVLCTVFVYLKHRLKIDEDFGKSDFGFPISTDLSVLVAAVKDGSGKTFFVVCQCDKLGDTLERRREVSDACGIKK